MDSRQIPLCSQLGEYCDGEMQVHFVSSFVCDIWAIPDILIQNNLFI